MAVSNGRGNCSKWSRNAAMITLGLGLAVPSGAANDDEIQRQLEALKASQDQILRENEMLRREIGAIRASEGEQWTSERRADEIRVVVQNVLADADQRAAMLDGQTAGWNEHFFLASPDGRFKVELDGHLQFRHIINYHNQNDRWLDGFEFTRAKLTMRGHVFNENTRFLLRTDPTRNEPGLVTGLFYLRDAWMAYDFTNEWSAKAGQFKLPFNREELVGSQYQMAVERSLVNESMNLGRTQGVEVQYAGTTDNFRLAFSEGMADEIGGFGSLVGTLPVNTNALNPGVEWAFTGRWEHLFAGSWEQFADFTAPMTETYGMMLGMAVTAQQGESNGNPSGRRNEQRMVGFTGDLSIEYPGASIFLSGSYHYVDNGGFGQIGVTGLVAQAAFYATPKLELFGRWEYGFWDFANSEFAVLSVITLGGNYYLDGHDLKLTMDLGYGLDDIDSNWDSSIAGWRTDRRGAGPQIVLRTQLQLLF